MSEYSGNDIYCDLIIPKKIDYKLIHETDNVLAFYHTKPFWPTHIVVVPKHHVPSLLELPDAPAGLASELLAVVAEMARMVKEQDGACRVMTNLGDYQDSKHLHIHVSSGKH
jgi:histidine triad (HIT) family protein